tara:strand:+ start:1033 stop:1320 length:288 start_codon:yes stop_codon:yes gene_type:complete
MSRYLWSITESHNGWVIYDGGDYIEVETEEEAYDAIRDYAKEDAEEPIRFEVIRWHNDGDCTIHPDGTGERHVNYKIILLPENDAARRTYTRNGD